VFAQLPFGQIISIAFFFILLIAALTSAISLLEVIVAFCTEELKWSRKGAVIATFLLIGFFGSLSSLSQGILADVKVFGKTFFDFFDYTSSNIMLPVGGLLVVLFVGWKMKVSDVYDELTSGATISLKDWIFNSILFIIKYVAPIAILIVLINSLL
jgi:NSS family neurotransmitter:Na+ symporter